MFDSSIYMYICEYVDGQIKGTPPPYIYIYIATQLYWYRLVVGFSVLWDVLSVWRKNNIHAFSIYAVCIAVFVSSTRAYYIYYIYKRVRGRL